MSVLTKPYPKDTTIKRKLIFAILFGLFVFLFLFFFQPFGINQWEVSNKPARLLGYGIITTIILLLHFFLVERIFPKWFSEPNWKVWKEIIWALWIIFVIGTCNLLYSRWQAGFALTISSFFMYQWITLLIGLFPVILSVLLNYNRLQSINLKAAMELNKMIESDNRTIPVKVDTKTVELFGEGTKETVQLDPDTILYIGAADNYVEVVWIENGNIRKKLLRNTLKNLESVFFNMPNIFRCHRSFMVNLKYVIKVTGNSQGYKLHFPDTETAVPVSRQFNNMIKEKMKSIHPN